MTAPLSVARLPPRRRRRLGLVALVVLFALVTLLSKLVPLAAECLWFQALSSERVFRTPIGSRWTERTKNKGALLAIVWWRRGQASRVSSVRRLTVGVDQPRRRRRHCR